MMVAGGCGEHDMSSVKSAVEKQIKQ